MASCTRPAWSSARPRLFARVDVAGPGLDRLLVAQDGIDGPLVTDDEREIVFRVLIAGLDAQGLLELGGGLIEGASHE